MQRMLTLRDEQLHRRLARTSSRTPCSIRFRGASRRCGEAVGYSTTHTDRREQPRSVITERTELEFVYPWVGCSSTKEQEPQFERNNDVFCSLVSIADGALHQPHRSFNCSTTNHKAPLKLIYFHSTQVNASGRSVGVLRAFACCTLCHSAEHHPPSGFYRENIRQGSIRNSRSRLGET